MKYSGLRNYEYSILYSVCTDSILYSILYTKTESVHRNTGERDCPNNPWGKALDGTVIRIPANAFTININSTNANTLIKANFSWEAKLNK